MSSTSYILFTLFLSLFALTVDCKVSRDIPVNKCPLNVTKPACAKYLFNQLTNWDNTVLCKGQDGRLHYFQDGIIHSANSTFSLWATAFTDGKLLELERFIEDSEFVQDNSVVRQSFTVYMDTYDTEVCVNTYGSVDMTYKDGTKQTLPVLPGGLYVEYSPSNPVESLKSVCGDFSSYVDIRFIGTITLSRSVI